MIFSAALITPAFTVPLAAIIAVWAGWYWTRLGRSDTPPIRRMMRRASLLVMIAALPVYVAGLSFIDPSESPSGYIWTWAIAMVLLMIVLFLAAADIALNLQLHRAEHDVQQLRSMTEIARVLETVRRDEQQADSGQAARDDAHDESTDDDTSGQPSSHDAPGKNGPTDRSDRT